MTIDVYIQIEFSGKRVPTKIQPHTQEFCKNKTAKLNRHLFSQEQFHLFTVFYSKNSLLKTKSPNTFLALRENFGLYIFICGF